MVLECQFINSLLTIYIPAHQSMAEKHEPDHHVISVISKKIQINDF